MIHLFNGCTGAIGGLFDICGSAISGFFGLFGKTCDGCAYFCNQCCKECDIASILARPCCCFVCFSSAMLIPAMVLIVMALTDSAAGTDDYQILAFAFVHWLFALYVQGRMGKALEELEQEEADKPQQQAMNANQKQKGQAEESLAKMGAIILYDIPFALYFFASFGTFIYAFVLNPNVTAARWLVVIFQILSLLFLIWWYMMTTCCAACSCCADYLMPPRKKKAPAQGNADMQGQNPAAVQMQGVPQQQPMTGANPNQAFAGASAPPPPPPV